MGDQKTGKVTERNSFLKNEYSIEKYALLRMMFFITESCLTFVRCFQARDATFCLFPPQLICAWVRFALSFPFRLPCLVPLFLPFFFSKKKASYLFVFAEWSKSTNLFFSRECETFLELHTRAVSSDILISIDAFCQLVFVKKSIYFLFVLCLWWL